MFSKLTSVEKTKIHFNLQTENLTMFVILIFIFLGFSPESISSCSDSDKVQFKKCFDTFFTDGYRMDLNPNSTKKKDGIPVMTISAFGGWYFVSNPFYGYDATSIQNECANVTSTEKCLNTTSLIECSKDAQTFLEVYGLTSIDASTISRAFTYLREFNCVNFTLGKILQ